MRKAGKTVFLTTHYMEEAEKLCDRVAIMDHGKILEWTRPGPCQIPIQRARNSVRGAGRNRPGDFLRLPAVIRAAAEDGEVVLYSDNVQKTLALSWNGPMREKRNSGDVHVRAQL